MSAIPFREPDDPEGGVTGRSPQTGQLLAALLAIIEKLPALRKDARNQQQGYNYVSETAIVQAFKPLAVAHGVLVLPLDVRMVGEKALETSSGNKARVLEAVVRYRILHRSGEYLDVEILSCGYDTSDKHASKLMTGAFKTALKQVFLVGGGDDPDAGPGKEPRGRAPRAQAQGDDDGAAPVSPEDRAYLRTVLLEIAGGDEDAARTILVEITKNPDKKFAGNRSVEQIKQRWQLRRALKTLIQDKRFGADAEAVVKRMAGNGIRTETTW